MVFGAQAFGTYFGLDEATRVMPRDGISAITRRQTGSRPFSVSLHTHRGKALWVQEQKIFKPERRSSVLTSGGVRIWGVSHSNRCAVRSHCSAAGMIFAVDFWLMFFVKLRKFPLFLICREFLSWISLGIFQFFFLPQLVRSEAFSSLATDMIGYINQLNYSISLITLLHSYKIQDSSTKQLELIMWEGSCV